MKDRQEKVIDEEQLQILLKKWQEILQLQSWDIVAHICRASEMGGNEKAATNEYTRAISSSVISIMDKQDYCDYAFPIDMEQVLVHELLHLWFCEFEPKNKAKYTAWERCVDKMATFLVSLHREKDTD